MCVGLMFQSCVTLTRTSSFLQEDTDSSPLGSSSVPSMTSTVNAKITCGQRCPGMAFQNSPLSFGQRNSSDSSTLRGFPSSPFRSTLARFTPVSPLPLLIYVIHVIVSEGAQTLGVPWFLRPIYRFVVVPLAFVAVEKGVYTSLFAAAGKKVKEEPENYRGAFLDPVAQLSKPSDDSLREDLADDLWGVTNRVLKDAGVF
jgi:hypothetical protein